MANNLRRRINYEYHPKTYRYAEQYLFSIINYEFHWLNDSEIIHIAKVTNHKVFKMAIIKIVKRGNTFSTTPGRLCQADLEEIYETYW